MALNASTSTRVVLLRTSVVLAPNGGALKKMRLPFKMGLGSVLGNGNQYMPWIHIEDYLSACAFIIDHDAIEGPVNLVAPEANTNRQFSKQLAKSLGSRLWLTTPAWVLKAMLGERACLLLDSQRVSPEKLLSNGFEFKFSNLTSALADIYKKK